MSRKFALLIANSCYDDVSYPTLKAPATDVIALEEVLRDHRIGNFDDVQILRDESVAIIKRNIESFFVSKKRDDLLFLYFSGHGDTAKWGQLYLVGKETQKNLLSSTAISSAFIREVMNASNSKQQLLVLDCCYSGAFFQGSKGDAQASTHIAQFFSGQGRVVLTAASAVEKAWEGDEALSNCSLFTHYFVYGLASGDADRDGDGGITIDELYAYTSEQIQAENPVQTPGKWVENQQGTLYIALNPHFVGERPVLPFVQSVDFGSGHTSVQGKASTKAPEDGFFNDKPDAQNQVSIEEKDKLVDLLLVCPMMRNRSSRETILRQLPSDMVDTIEQSSMNRTEVINIVDSCLLYTGGLHLLIGRLRFFERNSKPMQNLENFLGTISHKL